MAERDDPMTVEKRLDRMGEDLRALRVLYENHDTQIQRIAELQVEHGKSLEEHGKLLREIKGELAPLRDLRDLVKRVAGEHESRIAALEKHASPQQEDGMAR
jgi:hypothetical protein